MPCSCVMLEPYSAVLCNMLEVGEESEGTCDLAHLGPLKKLALVSGGLTLLFLAVVSGGDKVG